MILDKQKPIILPINRVGAKIPPTPPAPKVSALATILKSISAIRSKTTFQMFDKSKPKMLFSSAFSGFPTIKLLITSNPSPYNGGIK